MVLEKLKKDADLIFKAALKEVDPYYAIGKNFILDGDLLKIKGEEFSLKNFDKIYIGGAGKASARMALAVEDILKDRVEGGVIVVKYDHTENLKKTEIVEAAHPVPDENGMKGAQKLLDLAKKADEKTLIIFLVSGGGSALTPLPSTGTTLTEKQEITGKLLRSGATIHEINTVRKNLSRIKGGKLAAAAYPATVISLILSDVVGDDLDIIASGMTVKDSSTKDDFCAILKKYNLDEVLKKSECFFDDNEGEKDFGKTFNFLVATNYDALLAAKRKAIELGYNSLILSSTIEGDTKTAAHMHSEIAKQIKRTGDPVEAPACILSGGETTLIVKGEGKGGRNQEFALECVEKLDGTDGILVCSAGTDGTDGPTDAAGAIADSGTLKDGIDKGLDFKDYLKRNDSYNYFDRTGRLIKTGPTKTNVMDIKIVLVD